MNLSLHTSRVFVGIKSIAVLGVLTSISSVNAANLTINGDFDTNNLKGWRTIRGGTIGTHSSVTWAIHSDHFLGHFDQVSPTPANHPNHLPDPGEGLVRLMNLSQGHDNHLTRNGVLCDLISEIPALSRVDVQLRARSIFPYMSSVNLSAMRTWGGSEQATAAITRDWTPLHLGFDSKLSTSEILINIGTEVGAMAHNQFTGYFAMDDVSVDFQPTIAKNPDFELGTNHWAGVVDGAPSPGNFSLSTVAEPSGNTVYGKSMSLTWNYPGSSSPINTGIVMTLDQKIFPGQKVHVGLRATDSSGVHGSLRVGIADSSTDVARTHLFQNSGRYYEFDFDYTGSMPTSEILVTVLTVSGGIVPAGTIYIDNVIVVAN